MKEENIPNIWFTADLHLCHDNIRKFCSREFYSVAEMNETLIRNYNELVSPKDWVFILGDLSFRGNNHKINEIFHRLNGNKVLIKGNHDNKHVVQLPWKSVHDTLMLKVNSISGHQDDKTEIFLSHYAHRTWNKSFHDVGHCFGHSHGNLPPQGLSFDVGVDCWDYKPISLQQVKDELERLKIIRCGYEKDKEYKEFLRLCEKFSPTQT